ncbi:MAG: hypothetical protein ACYTBR_03115 [Planctomycetota bacterium]|jgi:hypothetical protein
MVWKAVGFTLLPLLAAGCSATPSGEGDVGARTDPARAVPADFSLDLTVRPGPDTGGPGPADPDVSLRWARYVLFCDGSLHWAAGGADPARGLPPQRRVLDQRQIAGLWSLLERLGYTDPQSAAAPVNVNLIEVAPGETVSVGVITGHGRRWAVASREGPDRKPDPAMPRLIEHLDGLAWATAADDPAAGALRRDEYGPDPYARYRRP